MANHLGEPPRTHGILLDTASHYRVAAKGTEDAMPSLDTPEAPNTAHRRGLFQTIVPVPHGGLHCLASQALGSSPMAWLWMLEWTPGVPSTLPYKHTLLRRHLGLTPRRLKSCTK